MAKEEIEYYKKLEEFLKRRKGEKIMFDLTVIEKDGQLVMDSREVAEMVEKNSIKNLSIPEYLTRVELIKDALRVADKMINKVS